MPKFFVPREQISENCAYILGADATHIAKVLRMKVGEDLCLCDAAGNDYDCRITDIKEDQISFDIVEKKTCLAEPSVEVTLFMAIPKGDKMDYVIQKTVELGVHRIVPFSASRCIVKLSGKDVGKKTARWQKIAYEAAKQCGRGIIPQVEEPISFSEVVGRVKSFDLPLFFYECEEKNSLKDTLSQRTYQKVCAVIGPEGGFPQDEVQKARNAGFMSVSLGKRILRCETAPGCAVCAIMYHTDNL